MRQFVNPAETKSSQNTQNQTKTANHAENTNIFNHILQFHYFTNKKKIINLMVLIFLIIWFLKIEKHFKVTQSY